MNISVYSLTVCSSAMSGYPADKSSRISPDVKSHCQSKGGLEPPRDLPLTYLNSTHLYRITA